MPELFIGVGDDLDIAAYNHKMPQYWSRYLPSPRSQHLSAQVDGLYHLWSCLATRYYAYV